MPTFVVFCWERGACVYEITESRKPRTHRTSPKGSLLGLVLYWKRPLWPPRTPIQPITSFAVFGWSWNPLLSLYRSVKLVGVSRGNTIRGNRTERFWEGNLPLRGSLRGSLRGEGFRGFQRFWEVFRWFERFSEGFQRPSQRPSQSAIFLSELGVVLPLIVLPLKTPPKNDFFSIDHARGNIYISNSWWFFDVYVFVLHSNSLTKNMFHICAFVSVSRWINAKSTRYVHLIQNRWCSEFSRMCMCIKFVTQVLKQKNAHVFLSVGMVSKLPEMAHSS